MRIALGQPVVKERTHGKRSPSHKTANNYDIDELKDPNANFSPSDYPSLFDFLLKTATAEGLDYDDWLDFEYFQSQHDAEELDDEEKRTFIKDMAIALDEYRKEKEESNSESSESRSSDSD